MGFAVQGSGLVSREEGTIVHRDYVPLFPTTCKNP